MLSQLKNSFNSENLKHSQKPSKNFMQMSQLLNEEHKKHILHYLLNTFIKNRAPAVPNVAQWKWIWLASMRTQVWSLTSLSGLRISIAVSYGVGCRPGLDPSLLWLWHRLVATALNWPLAWEPPYATDAALCRGEKKKDKNRVSKMAYKYLVTQFHPSFSELHY